jgi:hypothetical protein
MVAVVASLPVKAKWTVIFTPCACLGSKATLAPVRKPSIDCGLIKLRTSLTMYQVIFFVTNLMMLPLLLLLSNVLLYGNIFWCLHHLIPC